MKNKTSKEVEKERYNQFASKKLKEKSRNITSLAPDCIPLIYRQPYLYYHELLQSISDERKGMHLDLCCGDGIHSFTTSPKMNVTAIDYSAKSIDLAKLKNEALMRKVMFKVGDVENLNFEDETFDLITIVGSLSYIDKNELIKKVLRALKPGGYFVCLDSLNNNPVYRINRFIHYLKGNRTFSTINRIPDLNFIKSIQTQFSEPKVIYFGKILFLGVLIRYFLGERITNSIINIFDRKINIPSLAFKFVFMGRKTIDQSLS